MDQASAKWRIDSFLVNLSEAQRQKIKMFHVELLKFSPAINLVSSGTLQDSDVVHILDGVLGSMAVIEDLADKTVNRIYDFGSGNGVPGVLLAILLERGQVVLVDQDIRKSEFLKTVKHRLGLKNLDVKCCSIDNLEDGSIFLAVSRGFCDTGDGIERFSKKFALESSWYQFKGPGWVKEVGECSTWNAALIKTYELTQVSRERMIIRLTKKAN